MGEIYEEKIDNIFIIRGVHKGRIFSKFILHHKSSKEIWNILENLF